MVTNTTNIKLYTRKQLLLENTGHQHYNTSTGILQVLVIKGMTSVNRTLPKMESPSQIPLAILYNIQYKDNVAVVVDDVRIIISFLTFTQQASCHCHGRVFSDFL